MTNTEEGIHCYLGSPNSYPGDVLPTPKTTKEILPIKYGTKKPQSCMSQQTSIRDGNKSSTTVARWNSCRGSMFVENRKVKLF